MQTRAKWLIKCGAAAAAVTLIATLAACQGAATGPNATGPDDGSNGDGHGNGGGGRDERSDTVVTTFHTHPPGHTTHVFGGVHKLVMPPRSVCDPTTSSYGPTEWDADCEVADTAITITAKSWTDAQGHPRVEFSPALRFAPNRDVVLYLKDEYAAADTSARILFCPDGAADEQCVDEAASDPSLQTSRDLGEAFVYRRIKHFSGYNVAAGRRRTS